MRILFIGYDKRYVYLIEKLKSKYIIDTIGYNDLDRYRIGDIDVNLYDIIVLPMSGIKEGYAANVKIDNDFFDNYKGVIYTGITKGIKGNVESFLNDKEIVYENTMITVDGILDKIKNIVIICILGYGNIGSILYEKLKDKYKVIVGVKEDNEILNKDFFVTSDSGLLNYYLSSSDLIINTVPKNIISCDILNNIGGYFLDIASFPYAIEQSKANSYNFKYDLYSSIPSKYAPKRAGLILLKKF